MENYSLSVNLTGVFFAERIGDAEVLAVHSEAESVQVPSLQEGDNA